MRKNKKKSDQVSRRRGSISELLGLPQGEAKKAGKAGLLEKVRILRKNIKDGVYDGKTFRAKSGRKSLRTQAVYYASWYNWKAAQKK